MTELLSDRGGRAKEVYIKKLADVDEAVLKEIVAKAVTAARAK